MHLSTDTMPSVFLVLSKTLIILIIEQGLEQQVACG